ncbi:MAG TPA: hypothetical protein VGS23_05900 [Thermoplasmata archaeon]|nr:hypothetical protein [Thermoplasmata archaeon]
MGYPTYAAPPGAPAMEPVEAASLRSMLNVARILAIVFGILFLLIGLADAAVVAYYASVCSTFVGYDAYCGGPVAFLLIGPVYVLILGAFNFLIYAKVKEIEGLVNNRQYESAKSQTLIWVILGFILGGVIVGIVLLVAYLKFDPLISWQRSGGMASPPYPGLPPTYAAPPAAPAYAAPPTAAAPPSAPAPSVPAASPAPAAAVAPSAPTTPCPRCGRPATWIAQYNRWYCTTEQQYL